MTNTLTGKNPVDAILESLGRLGKTAKATGQGQWLAQCPAHDDKNPSLSISDTGDRTLLHCHAGCSTEQICQALGLTLADLFSEGKHLKPQAVKKTYQTVDDIIEAIRKQTGGELAGRWTYNDTFEMLRFNFSDKSKTFRPIYNSGSGWVQGDPPGELPLYRVASLNGEHRVYVTEGEKAADAARSIGLPAFTSAHGSKSASKTNWTLLSGKEIVILPDNDMPGRKYAESVAAIVIKLSPPATVRIIDLPGLSEGGDIYDYLEGRDSTEPETIKAYIEQLADQAELYTIETETPKTPPQQQRQSCRAMCSDMGNADRLVYRHGNNLRYCVQLGTWFIWNGKRWKPDESFEILQLAKDTVLQIFDEAKGLAADGLPEKSGLVSSWAARSQAREKLAAMVDLARCEVAVTPDQLDVDNWLLNCENGTLDLRTGKLKQHNQADLITKIIPVEFHENAKCPLWLSFLDRIMAGSESLISYLQRIAGMCLTGDITEQLLFIFFGTGCNGKSVFVDTLLGIMGDYAGEAPPDLLIAKTNNEHPTEIADLCGRRLIVASETENEQQLKIQLIKRLTGNSRLKARKMRQDFFEFDRTHKMILVTNNKPSVQEQTNAVWRRLRLIPFSVTIPDREIDPNLLAKLRVEWPGILFWCVRGCLSWQRAGLQQPDEVTAATKSYQAEQHPLAQFFDESCIFTATAETTASDLRGAYETWAAKHGSNPLTPRKFNEELRNRGCAYETQRRFGNTAKVWVGIELQQFIGDSVTTVTGFPVNL